MSSTAEQPTSLGEFLAWEREQPQRYEYAGGIITMTPAGRRHMPRSR
jgi:Uma2 family endonuclease